MLAAAPVGLVAACGAAGPAAGTKPRRAAVSDVLVVVLSVAGDRLAEKPALRFGPAATAGNVTVFAACTS